MMPYPIVGVAVGFVALCVASDVRTRRIPNLLSGGAMVGGLLLNGLYGGGQGLAGSLAGLALLIGLLLPPFALGGIGGGDVKMMGGVGALLGVQLGFAALTIGMLLGGAVMLAHLARLGRLREKLVHTTNLFSLAVLTRSTEPLRVSAADPGAISLPYSVPLGLGTVAAIITSQTMGSI